MGDRTEQPRESAAGSGADVAPTRRMTPFLGRPLQPNPHVPERLGWLIQAVILPWDSNLYAACWPVFGLRSPRHRVCHSVGLGYSP